MKIETITLKNYRNIEDLSLSFASGVQVITGENAQGKTNILEAIFLSSTMRSFRAGKENMLIRYGKEEASVDLCFEKNDREQSLRIELGGNESKKVYLDGRRLTRTRDAIGLFQSVLFTPDHLMMIKGAPGERREFLDMTLCAQSPGYTENLLQYNKALKNRNRLLKSEDPALLATLPMWDELLAKYGSAIAFARQNYILQLDECAGREYAAISGDREKMKLVYLSPFAKEPISKEEFATRIFETLNAHHERDRENESTTVGVHKDDLLPLLSGKSAKFFASQGQVRSTVLAIKMAEAMLLEQNSGQKPVILLDDILSELDPGRQEYILRHTFENQCIVTACEPDKLSTICKDYIWIEGGRQKDVSASRR